MRKTIHALLAAVALVAPLPALAATTVLAGSFDGSEARGAPLPGTCGGSDLLSYQEAAPLQVSVAGRYSVLDVLYLGGIKYNGVDLSILLYEGPFDIDDPYRFLVRPVPFEDESPDAVDTYGWYDLEAGRTYQMVVQQWCENREGAWSVSFTGPGEVVSDDIVTGPGLVGGRIESFDPVAATACGNSQYRVTGPLQVSASGTYYYQDVSLWAQGIDSCVQVYTSEFDPQNPNVNRVPTSDPVDDILDDSGTIELEAGRDYWFVVQPLDFEDAGDYFYVLAPPAPFRISNALAGAWFNPDIPGQGFFLDVYENIDQMFGGWYTFELQRPADDEAQLGEAGHRWLTVQGDYAGAQAQLTVYLARGGVFDAAEPAVELPQPEVGTVAIEFSDCMNGVVDYDLDEPAVSGRIPLVPLTDNHVELCRRQTRAPAAPGPL